MTELLPCPFCGEAPKAEGKYVGCVTEDCLMEGLTFILSAWNTRAPIPATPSADRVREAAVWLCSCVDKARRSGFGLEHEELLDLVEQVEEALSKEQAALAHKEGR